MAFIPLDSSCHITICDDSRNRTQFSYSSPRGYFTVTQIDADQCYTMAKALIAEGDRQRNEARDNARMSDICEAMRLDEGAVA